MDRINFIDVCHCSRSCSCSLFKRKTGEKKNFENNKHLLKEYQTDGCVKMYFKIITYVAPTNAVIMSLIIKDDNGNSYSKSIDSPM